MGHLFLNLSHFCVIKPGVIKMPRHATEQCVTFFFLAYRKRKTDLICCSKRQQQSQASIKHNVIKYFLKQDSYFCIFKRQIILRSNVLRHHFYLPKVLIQVITCLEYSPGQFHAFKTWNQPFEYSITILNLHHYLR